jgi:hypothetical protein
MAIDWNITAGNGCLALIDRRIAFDRSHVCERTIRMEEIDA